MLTIIVHWYLGIEKFKVVICLHIESSLNHCFMDSLEYSYVTSKFV